MGASTANSKPGLLATISPEGASSVLWGREAKARFDSSLGCLGLILGCPILIVLNWVALEQYSGALLDTVQAALADKPVLFLLRNLPRPSATAFLAYTVWVLLQAGLYALLPGKACYGQQTPGGNQLRYVANGLAAWAVTHLLYLTASVLGLIDPAFIARNWEGLIVAFNVYGFSVATFALLKGYWFPSHPEDRKFSGSWVFDLWCGIELNPRFGKNFDIKFFHNGRIGMVAWTLIDLSFAAYQYQNFGYVTESMLIVLILHTIYNIDFFCNEDWYTRTIDISHDHFGFMLAWGDSTFLPTFYTLQAQYLSRYPTHLTPIQSASILALGFLGYAIFRQANHQRDLVRSNPEATIWGRKATFIRTTYLTTDNKVHNSLLLTSGWWGAARHANYLADLMQCVAFCVTCGVNNLLPWSYFIFMFILLHHRAWRDERRCKNKYGEKWDEYCRVVPYRMIPGVY